MNRPELPKLLPLNSRSVMAAYLSSCDYTQLEYVLRWRVVNCDEVKSP